MEKALKSLLMSKEMSIIVSLPENSMELAQSAIEAGADALKFHINVAHRASGNEFKGLEYYTDMFKKVRESFSGPLGIVMGDNIQKVNHVNIEKLKQVGFNYFSLYAKDIPSKLLIQEDLERTVAIDDRFNFAQVQGIESFDIEAVELSIVKKENYGHSLNFEDIVAYRNYRKNTRLPLIVPSQKELVLEDLSVLKEIGINAVMLGAVTIGTSAETIFKTVSKFKKQIENIYVSQG